MSKKKKQIRCVMCGRSVDSDGDPLQLLRHHKEYGVDSYVGSNAKKRDAEMKEHPERFVFLCKSCHSLVHILAKLPARGKRILSELIKHDPTANFVFQAKKQRLKLDASEKAKLRQARDEDEAYLDWLNKKPLKC